MFGIENSFFSTRIANSYTDKNVSFFLRINAKVTKAINYNKNKM